MKSLSIALSIEVGECCFCWSLLNLLAFFVFSHFWTTKNSFLCIFPSSGENRFRKQLRNLGAIEVTKKVGYIWRKSSKMGGEIRLQSIGTDIANFFFQKIKKHRHCEVCTNQNSKTFASIRLPEWYFACGLLIYSKNLSEFRSIIHNGIQEFSQITQQETVPSN